MHRLVALLIIFTFSFSYSPCDAQIWSRLKEKAKEAWHSDTRKKVWNKAKETTSKALEPYEYTVPITERKFVDIIPDSKMNSLGAQRYRAYMKSASVSHNKAKKAQVKRVVNRLIKAVDRFYSDQGIENNFNWEFNLVKSSQINAWCMPGGKIVVYEGIMTVAKDDASLAIVLGHEIAHAIAKHSAEQMTKSIISAVGITGIYIMINNSDMSARKRMLAKLMASAGVSLANLKFSRIDETEADHIGLILAAMAGYDPNAAIPFWKRMGKATGNRSKHDWYSTHPSNSNRIENIRSFLPEAMEYYR